MVDESDTDPRSSGIPPVFDAAGQVNPGCTPEQCAQARQKKIIVGVLAIVLGCLGVHKFVLGNIGAGIVMLVVSVVGGLAGTCLCLPGLAAYAMGLVGLIEGIIYLAMPDDQFYRTHIVGKRPWF